MGGKPRPKINKMKTRLPAFIAFNDYHDGVTFGNNLIEIIPNVKHEEVCSINGKYFFMFFVKEDKAYHEMRKELKKREKEFWDRWEVIQK